MGIMVGDGRGNQRDEGRGGKRRDLGSFTGGTVEGGESVRPDRFAIRVYLEVWSGGLDPL